MDTVSKRFERWMEKCTPEERTALQQLAESEEAVNDAFYRDLTFGTAGLRGVIGMGTNRMNIYSVGRATQGLANYLNAHFESPSVAIARDSRNMGEEFVRSAAQVLAANGVHVYVHADIQPTPVLSFTVRDFSCSAGINVTASHNPAEYSGYKVYGSDGCQIASTAAREIQESIDSIDFFDDVKRTDYDRAVEEGLIEDFDQTVVDRFMDAVAAQSVEPLEYEGDAHLKVVYTPLNGTGLSCVLRILERVGIDDVSVVPEQEAPDGNFPTCPYPNPEDRAALQLGLKLCERVKPDLLLATDPDADRVGIAVAHAGTYQLLTGNEVGVLILDYLCAQLQARGEDLQDKVVVSTVVSSLMPDTLAKYYGFELRRVLTGFKYIGGQIALLEDAGHAERFIFGFEESYGYMSGAHVRDKDAVNASMLICQMARWHKDRGHDLVEAMDSLYARYGFYLNRTVNVQYPGSDGALKMASIMKDLKAAHPSKLGRFDVARFEDFSNGVSMPTVNSKDAHEQMLPPAELVSFEIADGTKILIRPSGTEPKIKAYVFAKAQTRAQAESLLDELETQARALLK